MIPFLKKNKDGKKPPKPTVPRTAQESVPFQRMFEDGTCRVRPGYYTRTIQYQDINYQLSQQEDKTAIFEEWCSFLNFFDSSIHFELSFVNTATDSADFEKSIRIPYQQDGFDDVRAEYSQMLRQQLSKGNNGLTKTKFLTYGIEGDSMAQVKPRLEHIYDFLSQKVDVHGARLAPELIDQFVEVVTPIADYSYRWKLNTGCKKSKEERADLMAVSEKPILTFTIDFETAKRYREANKMPHQFRRAAWTDLTVEVYL